MNVRKLNHDLVNLGISSDRMRMFERAVSAVLNDEPRKVVGVDNDGDDVFADSLLDAFDLVALHYADDDTIGVRRQPRVMRVMFDHPMDGDRFCLFIDGGFYWWTIDQIKEAVARGDILKRRNA